MAKENDEVTHKDQESVKPAGSNKEELSEKDLDKAAGGFNKYSD